MDKKKKPNKGLVILGLLFAMYLLVLYSKSNGYYEYKEYKKSQITNEAMKRFEEDIKNGKDLNINNYIDTSTKDYSNGISKISAKIGEESKKVVISFFKKIGKVLGKLFT